MSCHNQTLADCGGCPGLQVMTAAAGATVEKVTVSLSPSTVAPQGQTSATVTLQPAASGHSVSLRASEVVNSGGHQHTGRPLGTFAASSGTANSSGQFQTTYTASQFGGTEQIVATIDGGQGNSNLTVDIGGLAQLGSGTHYALVGATATHPSNHYATSTANSNLVAVPNAYAAHYPGSVFNYNDQSLVRGGLFDISASWTTPHIEHRCGTNSDISKGNVPSDRDTYITTTIFPQNGVTSTLDEGDHWQVSLGNVCGTGAE